MLTSSAPDKHLDGALGPKVGFHDIMQSFCCINIHEQGCTPAHDLGLGVQSFDRRHVDAELPPRVACLTIRGIYYQSMSDAIGTVKEIDAQHGVERC